MALVSLALEKFTAFEKLQLDFSPGLNVLIGANGTGKTHILKVCYAACDVTKTQLGYAEKLVRVFLPSGRAPGRLVKRHPGRTSGSVVVRREGKLRLRATISTQQQQSSQVRVLGSKDWQNQPLESVFIPVKEMLSNAPGFRSLYSQRELHFEEIYADIVDRAYLPIILGRRDERRQKLLETLQQAMNGKVVVTGEEFYLKNKQGNLEFTLLAEGFRKLGLLWLLIQNGTLAPGSVLFWDEPETNLNPKLMQTLITLLLELQRGGVQVFLATHDYVILKELDLQSVSTDQLLYHSLHRDSKGEIACHSTDRYLDIHPNAIAETFAGLYDREIERMIQGAK